MNNFDLNLEHYTTEELTELFELPPNRLSKQLIEDQETKLRKNILRDPQLNTTVKTNTLAFLRSVKDKLLNLNHDNNSSIENLYNLNHRLAPSSVVNAPSTFLIQQPPTPYSQSSPSEFYQGTINPLNKRILRQNINIDTRFRDNYLTTSSTNFHLYLPLRLTNVVSLQLSALEIPPIFYAISNALGNNYLSILDLTTSSCLFITIPDGNYTPNTLVTYLNDHQSSLIFSFHPISSLIQAYNPSSSSSLSLVFQTDRHGNDDKQTPLPLKLGWMMGFRRGSYDMEPETSATAEGVPSLDGPKYIYLVVDDFNNSVLDGFYGAFTSSILNKNILARISLQPTLVTTSKDNLNLITTPRQYFGPVDIQKLQIQVLDEYGRVISFNHMDYSFCLTFQTIYDL